MTVEEITLLSKEKYEKYKSAIPKIDYWWWLRSPGYDQSFAAFVRFNGNIDEYGEYVHSDYGAIRPALKLNLEMTDNRFWYKPDKLIGTKIKYGNYQWTILDTEYSELYVLCDESIMMRRFDFKSNEWDKSELKGWLETDGLRLIAGEGDNADDC